MINYDVAYEMQDIHISDITELYSILVKTVEKFGTLQSLYSQLRKVVYKYTCSST